MKILVGAISLVFTGSVAGQNNYGHCESIINKGLREYSIQTTSKESLNVIFDNYCEASGGRKSSGTSFGLDTVVKMIPVNLSFGSSSAEDSMRNFCKNYSSTRFDASNKYSYEEKIVSKAYDTFNQCIRFTSVGVNVVHNVLNVEASSFFLQASVNSPLELKGVTTSNNVACEGQDEKNQIIPITKATYMPIPRTLTFACKRIPDVLTDKSQSFNEGYVQVLTNIGVFEVLLPPDKRASETMAVEFQRKIDDLAKQVGSVSSRVSQIKLKVGQVESHGTFGCGQQSVESDPSFFMVGSRDGTSCGVPNTNYVRKIELDVPPQ